MAIKPQTKIAVTRETAEEAAEFLKRLANPNRLLIACALIDGERSVGDLEIAIGLRQPSLSQQLADLRDSGIVSARREAKQVFYSLADPRATALLATLHELFCGGPLDPRPAAFAQSAATPPSRSEAATFARVMRP